ncbi:MAG: type VI secretion system tube protein TssD [Dysgonomonas sp.]|nr:type VI secretion system tube protein TssD [Dysgonomonas sp.]
MAFRATLTLGGKEFDVLDCSYSLKRDVDSKGRPSSNIYGGKVKVHVESTEDTSILESMVSQFKPVSGTIVFKKGDEEAKMKELTFENGYIIEFDEEIDIIGKKPMTLSFVVSAQVLKIGGAQFEQNWPTDSI